MMSCMLIAHNHTSMEAHACISESGDGNPPVVVCASVMSHTYIFMQKQSWDMQCNLMDIKILAFDLIRIQSELASGHVSVYNRASSQLHQERV